MLVCRSEATEECSLPGGADASQAGGEDAEAASPRLQRSLCIERALPCLCLVLDVLCSLLYVRRASTPVDEYARLRHACLKHMTLLFELSRSKVTEKPSKG